MPGAGLGTKQNPALRMKARLLPFGFGLLLQPQYMRTQRIEALFSDVAEQRILMTGYGRSDCRPVLRPKGLKRRRKEILILHHHVVPLVPDKIANNGIDILSKNFTIREHVPDRLSDAAQALQPLYGVPWQRSPTFSSRNLGSRVLSLAKTQVFLGMVIHFRVDFEIADNRANNLVVGAVSPVENLKFPLEDGKQLLNIAVLLG